MLVSNPASLPGTRHAEAMTQQPPEGQLTPLPPTMLLTAFPSNPEAVSQCLSALSKFLESKNVAWENLTSAGRNSQDPNLGSQCIGSLTAGRAVGGCVPGLGLLQQCGQLLTEKGATEKNKSEGISIALDS